MKKSTNFSQKEFIVLVLIAGLLFSIVAVINNRRSCSDYAWSAFNNPITEDDLRPGLEEAYDRLIRRGHATMIANGYGFKESEVIGGKIRQIDNGKIVLGVMPVNPLALPELDERIVLVDTNTKYYKEDEDTGNNSEIEFSELNVGDLIMITSDHMIHDEKQFKATEILLE